MKKAQARCDRCVVRIPCTSESHPRRRSKRWWISRSHERQRMILRLPLVRLLICIGKP